MAHFTRFGIILALLAVAVAASAAPARTVDLLTGLQTGELWAQLHGAGDTQVTGVIGRTGTEPLIAQIDPGTLYLAQRGGFNGSASGNDRGSFGQGGGRQGQLGLGGQSVNLAESAVARVVIATACTNLGLPAPTPADAMTPMPCPDTRLVRLAMWPGLLDSNPRPAVQLAVWAITDNPRASAIRRYLREAKSDDTAIDQAQQLLIACGVGARGFRLFR